MKRMFDLVSSVIAMVLLSPVLIIVSLLIKIDSPGPVFFKQKRVGQNNVHFTIYKFRTMKIGTPDIPTHLIKPSDYVTNIGNILRKSSIDEIPQLINILIGDMSFVGPRPALYNQENLINARNEKGIHKLIPGITGWAQINGRDEISISEKVILDEFYQKNQSMIFDAKIILSTFFSVLLAKGIRT